MCHCARACLREVCGGFKELFTQLRLGEGCTHTNTVMKRGSGRDKSKIFDVKEGEVSHSLSVAYHHNKDTATFSDKSKQSPSPLQIQELDVYI